MDKNESCWEDFLNPTGEKLPPELKVEWLAALRSGNFPQTTGRLHSIYGYCCLGVVCELTMGRFEEKPKWKREDQDFVLSYRGGFSEEYFLPWFLEEAAGVSRPVQELLANLNDGNKDKGIRKHTFAEIADWIEREL